MKVIDVYQQYFAASCHGRGAERRGVSVTLTATSDEGTIRYEAGVTFFPHRSAEDFAVSYDLYAQRELYCAKGRRSKKREAALLESLHDSADELAASLGGRILWDSPLREARHG